MGCILEPLRQAPPQLTVKVKNEMALAVTISLILALGESFSLTAKDHDGDFARTKEGTAQWAWMPGS